MKKIKNNWYFLMWGRIYEDKDLFSHGGVRLISVGVFINNNTGETRTFLRSYVEQKGEDFFIRKLYLEKPE